MPVPGMPEHPPGILPPASCQYQYQYQTLTLAGHMASPRGPP